MTYNFIERLGLIIIHFSIFVDNRAIVGNVGAVVDCNASIPVLFSTESFYVTSVRSMKVVLVAIWA